jgi:hypothetical protein
MCSERRIFLPHFPPREERAGERRVGLLGGADLSAVGCPYPRPSFALGRHGESECRSRAKYIPGGLANATQNRKEGRCATGQELMVIRSRKFRLHDGEDFDLEGNWSLNSQWFPERCRGGVCEEADRTLGLVRAAVRTEELTQERRSGESGTKKKQNDQREESPFGGQATPQKLCAGFHLGHSNNAGPATQALFHVFREDLTSRTNRAMVAN